MRQILETGAFLGLAAAVHVLAFFAMSDQDGLETGGVGGTDVLTLAAVSDAVETMVETWEAPSKTPTDVTVIDTLSSVSPISDAPPLAQALSQDAQVKIAAIQALPDLRSETEASPSVPLINTETAPPPELERKPDPVAKPEPKPKPQKNPPPKAPQKTEPKAKKSNVTSQGRAAQKAAGSGGGKAIGNSGNKSQTALSAGKAQSLMRGWQSRIQARLNQRQRTPRGDFTPSRVDINITLDRTGKVLTSKIVRSSPDPKVNQAALDTINRAGRMPKAPKNLPGGATFIFSVPLFFR